MAMEVRQLVDGGQTAWRRRVNILGVEGKRRAKGGQHGGRGKQFVKFTCEVVLAQKTFI
jgi:hypothetical protein